MIDGEMVYHYIRRNFQNKDDFWGLKLVDASFDELDLVIYKVGNWSMIVK